MLQNLRQRFARGESDGADVPVRDWVSSGQPPRMAGFDQTMVWVVLALLGLGLLMVYSASIALFDSPKFANYQPNHFLIRHAFGIGVGLVAALVTVQIPVAFWERAAPWLFVGALLLLVVVLIPHVGKGVNGARRWLPLGVMNFQPSELA
ncbi:MAG TPA: FtsW/RodA/SpoVE family cell cycle protein, partial [Burkholderiaceae bacterium]